ncbi:MAG: cyclic nucleotide-binding domain-containing protein [Armatimonadetes bacterium]|nr:cyclic nucleotide-binding domain-containing protein [Armatimonadota bacterium]
MNKSQAIMNSLIFEDLRGIEVKKVEEIAFLRSYEAGDIIFKEGDPADAFCIIANGEVEILGLAPDGAHFEKLASLKEGNLVGEVAIFDNYARSATVRAVSKTVLLVVYKTDFFKLLLECPSAGVKALLRICRLFSLRLRKANASYISVVSEYRKAFGKN